MGFFTKKNKNVVDEEIPSLPNLPDLPEESFRLPDVPPGLPKIETSNLPALPNTGIDNQFNQQIIKEKINEPRENMFSMQETSNSEKLPSLSSERRTLELAEPYEPKKLIRKSEPIYVRLDKFENAIETFGEIKDKINEIERLLEKTKRIRQEEEKELESWEREIQIIKSRIDVIDKSIFNKLD